MDSNLERFSGVCPHKRKSGDLIYHALPCSLEMRSLTEPGARLAAPESLLFLIPIALRLKTRMCSDFGAGDLNSGLHAFTASALTH